MREVALPPGIVKNRKPLTLPLSFELVSMLMKKFRTSGPVFDMRNFKREWIKGCFKIGVRREDWAGVVSSVPGSHPSVAPRFGT